MENNKLLKTVLLLLICLFGAYIYMYPPSDGELPTGDCQPITMSKSMVDDMINNYKKNQLLSITENQANPIVGDAESVWFDLETLSTFMATIACKAPKDNKGMGVRFYYAAYPDAEMFGKEGIYSSLADFNNDPIKKQYGKKHTLIMIPTINIDGKNQDFNPTEGEKEADGTQKVLAVSKSSDIMAQNHGQLCPPYLYN